MAKIRGKLFKNRSCDQCSPSVINGVFCHERGCPNEGKIWDVDKWVGVYVCDICGYEVGENEPCCEPC
jgi:hypothetical protein